MTLKNVFNPIFHQMVSNLAPWHSYVGGPDFPEKPLYSRNIEFKDVSNVAVNYDSKNKLQSIIAESIQGDNASVEFELVEEPSPQKMVCTLKKNATTELIISEWFENDKMYLTFRRPNCTEYDIDITVLPVNGEVYKFDVEIKFNNKLFKETIIAKSLDVPKIALDFSKEISSMQSILTISAADPRIIGVITMEAYKMFYTENRNPAAHIANLVGSLIGHLCTACVGGIIIHIISMLLIPDELH